MDQNLPETSTDLDFPFNTRIPHQAVLPYPADFLNLYQYSPAALDASESPNTGRTSLGRFTPITNHDSVSLPRATHRPETETLKRGRVDQEEPAVAPLPQVFTWITYDVNSEQFHPNSPDKKQALKKRRRAKSAEAEDTLFKCAGCKRTFTKIADHLRRIGPASVCQIRRFHLKLDNGEWGEERAWDDWAYTNSASSGSPSSKHASPPAQIDPGFS